MPRFSAEFDCEFVLVTEIRFFDAIGEHPAIAQLRAYASVRLRPIDDLISQWYGITLTYALVRGFCDLDEQMVGAHLLFFNADFVVADGCLTKIAEAIRAGERLVCAPSYCVVQETFIQELAPYADTAERKIAVPHRAMAQLILEHRHNTIRAKTINQPLFRLHRQDQFYWQVDDQTMLGRQLPIAIVYMQPERVVTEMTTFWDYGAKSAFCPTTVPLVLGDSDDFLMAELRGEATFADLLHLGSFSPAEIAADWSTFVVQDHLDFAESKLVLHADALPAQTSSGDVRLSDFVAAVCARIGTPISNRNHPFWAGAIDLFHAARQENLRRNAAAPDLSAGTAPMSVAIRLYRRAFGQLPHTTPWHPCHSSFLTARHTFLAAAAGAHRVLIVASGGALALSLVDNAKAQTITPLMAAMGFGEPFDAPTQAVDLCFCQLSFGELWAFPAIAERVTATMAPRGKLILFHHNLELRQLDDWAFVFAKACFPRFGSSSLQLAGSRPAAWASRWFHYALPRLSLATWRGRLTLAAILAVCAPLARLGTWIEARRQTNRAPSVCTSFIIDIDLP